MKQQLRIQTALGPRPADLLLKGGRIVDVFTGQIYTGRHRRL